VLCTAPGYHSREPFTPGGRLQRLSPCCIYALGRRVGKRILSLASYIPDLPAQPRVRIAADVGMMGKIVESTNIYLRHHHALGPSRREWGLREPGMRRDNLEPQGPSRVASRGRREKRRERHECVGLRQARWLGQAMMGASALYQLLLCICCVCNPGIKTGGDPPARTDTRFLGASCVATCIRPVMPIPHL